MTERLLHYIWQFQFFSRDKLTTTTGEPLQILFAGLYNINQGPDFSDAKIKVGNTTWAGTVELHLRTSDWIKHNHQADENFNNVILHVVWEDDTFVNDLPVLELRGRVSGILLRRYEELMLSASFIPCEKMICHVNELIWKSWKDRLLAERLMRKAENVEQMLKENNCHWEETFWWMLAGNFGAKVNTAAFEAMARTLPLNILGKHRSRIQQLEALLMGQAGLLKKNPEINSENDAYFNMLQREFFFLQKKYGLRPIRQPVHFLRMRPGNFPTIRLAQLASLLQHPRPLFSTIRDTILLKHVRDLFDITANDYWHYHYRFGETSGFKRKKLGGAMLDNIIINTLGPVLFAYGNYHHEQGYKDRAMYWMEKTAAEKNSITNGFEELGIENKNAFDSQALIELKNRYCNTRRCLECGLGNVLLKSSV